MLVKKESAGAGGMHRARVSRRFGMEGLPEQTARFAVSPCLRACGSFASRSTDFHAVDQSAVGSHDVNITFDDIVARSVMKGPKRCATPPSRYIAARESWRRRKASSSPIRNLEFGIEGDDIILIDEVLTPDSSRFWPMDGYQPGQDSGQFRQAVRARLFGQSSLGYEIPAAGTSTRDR